MWTWQLCMTIALFDGKWSCMLILLTLFVAPCSPFFVLAGTVEQCSHWHCVVSQIYHLFSCCRKVCISRHVCHERSARQTETEHLFFLSNYHVIPRNIPRNCCFTPLCIWLDDLLAENAWSCGNLESNIAFVALQKLVHLWRFFGFLKKFSRRYAHRSSLSSRFIILKHLESRICTLGIPCCNAWVGVSLCLS